MPSFRGLTASGQADSYFFPVNQILFWSCQTFQIKANVYENFAKQNQLIFVENGPKSSQKDEEAQE